MKDFLKQESPDIFCVQETKAFEEQFLADKNLGKFEGYDYIWHKGERPGYAGTAIFYKNTVKVTDTKNDFESSHFTQDGRVTELEFTYNGNNIVLLNGYFPNGGTRADGTEMLTYKLEFYDELIQYIEKRKAEGNQVIVTGDYNICHTEIDIARPEANKNSIGFLPVEREKVSEFLSHGMTDMFRYFYPEQLDTYSWWSYRAGARARNVGWRIDYFCVNNDFVENVKDMKYMTDILGSDHCPICLELK